MTLFEAQGQYAYFVQIGWVYLISITSYCADKADVLEFWVKMTKMTMKIKINDSHFQYQLRVSQGVQLM